VNKSPSWLAPQCFGANPTRWRVASCGRNLCWCHSSAFPASAKAYIDIDTLIANGITLPMALSAGLAIYGAAFNPQITLKALSFYEDGNLATSPGDIRSRLVRAVAAVDLDHLPNLVPIRRPAGIAQ
jgi:hypothetical protein